MDLASELRAVVKALAVHKIPYALVGGLAVAVWGAQWRDLEFTRALSDQPNQPVGGCQPKSVF